MRVERGAALLLAIGLLFSANPAAAAVRSFYAAQPSASQGTLRVTSDADDSIVVSCIGGTVEVNGAPPDTGPVECWRANRIEIIGGPGDNRIDSGGIAPSQSSGTFRGVAAYALIDGGGGDDAIIGPTAGLVTLLGGAGNDRLQGHGTAIDTYVFAPALAPERDTIVEPITSKCSPSYFGTNQPGLSYWTVPWDALDFSSLPADDDLTVDERAPAGVLASHRNRIVVSARTGFGVAVEAVAGGAGDDRLVVGCMAVGGTGNDSLEATGSDGDLLLGGPGNDKLTGRYGPDRLDGGPGADELDGGGGADALVGAGGNDVLRGGQDGDTYLFGSADGSQADSVAEVQGIGTDVLSFDLEADAPVSVDLAARAGVIARARGLELRGQPGAGRLIEGVVGGQANDRMLGHDGCNHFWSGGGTDFVAGGRGNDVYHVDWAASLPYAAYEFGEVWDGPFERGAQAGRSVWRVRETPWSALRILERPGGGFDTIDLAEQFLSHPAGGGRLEGQVTGGVRLDLTAPLWVTRTERVGALTARRHGSRYVEGIRGTSFDDVLIGNSASNVLEGRQGRDRVVGGKGKDLCLTARDGDRLRGCERTRRVDPDR